LLRSSYNANQTLNE